MLSLRVVTEAPTGPREIFVVSDKGLARVVVEERDILFPQISFELNPHYQLELRMDEHGRFETPIAVASCLWQGHARPIRGELKWLDDGVSIAVPFGFFTRHGNH